MEFEVLVDVIQKAAAAFALLVGGIWVLMNYVLSRTHVARLQIDLRATVVERGSRQYLHALIRVKNPGSSIITFPTHQSPGAGPRGSALLVSSLAAQRAAPGVIECRWEEPNAFEVLARHESIEPGLTINEEKLLKLPNNDCDAFWLRLRIAAHGRSWSADTIAVPMASAKVSNDEDD